MKLWGIDIGLLFKLKKVKDAVDNETKAGFSWKINALKGVKNFLYVSSGVAVAALADYFSIPANVALFFQWLPDSVRTVASGALTGVIVTAFMSLGNWNKNRNNVLVTVVPVAEATPGDKRQGPQAVVGAAPITLSMKPPVPPATEPTIPAVDAGV